MPYSLEIRKRPGVTPWVTEAFSSEAKAKKRAAMWQEIWGATWTILSPKLDIVATSTLMPVELVALLNRLHGASYANWRCVADKLDFSDSTIRRWRNGGRPSKCSLAKLRAFVEKESS